MNLIQAPAPRAAASSADIDCDLLVLGAGPGGYSAAFRAADLGLKTVLVERFATLGGVCLNVGCIPSKALLHHAEIIDEARALAAHGIDFGTPKIDLNGLRQFKQKVVGKLTQGLAQLARARKVNVVRGSGQLIDAHHLAVDLTDGSGKTQTGVKKIIHFKQAIIAAGSRVARPSFLPDDPRIIDSTAALDLADIPSTMLIIGGGIIGLEMGTLYSTLGTRLEIVEMTPHLMQGADRDMVQVWFKRNAQRFDRVMLNTKTIAVKPQSDGVWVSFEGEQAPSHAQRYDRVLFAVGRLANGQQINAQAAGVQVTERGFIPVDKQMRSNVPHIFAIGDIASQPMLAHKAVHEAHVAAEVAAGHQAFFDARVIPSVAYTHPEVAWVGLTEEEAAQCHIAIEKAVFPWAASGRAIAMENEDGLTKLLFDPTSKRIVGGAIVGARAGDLISEMALAIEMGCDAEDIGKTIHPHPTLGETVGMAAELFNGVCTDLPRSRGQRSEDRSQTRESH